MISEPDKRALLIDFLSSAYYCDFSVSRNEEEMITIRDTLEQYAAWYKLNVSKPHQKMVKALKEADLGWKDAKAMIASGDLSDLSTLDVNIKDMLAFVESI